MPGATLCRLSLTTVVSASVGTAQEVCVDVELVDIRDAIAHGRVSAASIAGPIHLLKFSKPEPEDECVEVTFSVALTAAWLDSQANRAADAVRKVNDANERLVRGKLA